VDEQQEIILERSTALQGLRRCQTQCTREQP
jgi:hypothetical protein